MTTAKEQVEDIMKSYEGSDGGFVICEARGSRLIKRADRESLNGAGTVMHVVGDLEGTFGEVSTVAEVVE